MKVRQVLSDWRKDTITLHPDHKQRKGDCLVVSSCRMDVEAKVGVLQWPAAARQRWGAVGWSSFTEKLGLRDALYGHRNDRA